MMKLFSCLDEVKALQDIEHIESRNYQLPVMRAHIDVWNIPDSNGDSTLD